MQPIKEITILIKIAKGLIYYSDKILNIYIRNIKLERI